MSDPRIGASVNTTQNTDTQTEKSAGIIFRKAVKYTFGAGLISLVAYGVKKLLETDPENEEFEEDTD